MKTKMKTHHALCGLISGLLLLAAGTATSHAGIIVSDTFTAPDGTSLNGRTPDAVNIPGRTYTTGSFDPGQGTQPNIRNFPEHPGFPTAVQGITGFNASTAIDISSNAGVGYTKPSQLTLSIDLTTFTQTDDNLTYNRGVGLGYFSSTPANGESAGSTFTGLVVSPNGTLKLVVNGVQQAANVAPFAGYAPLDNMYNLRYTVDTTTGSITNAVFNGVDETGVFSGATTAGDFTAGGTNLAGFYGSTATDNSFSGLVDNFTVSDVTPVPEPGTTLFGFACIGAAALRRRRNSAAA